ncbi:holin [Aeromicrobium sp. 9AM]|uniref:holin n=1 Tax=Aeromicrobium sp. 9AM TaxID=2653126 RepID=UPI0012F28ADB|nr:holin [Aeromicrobium sp. 9AM]VXB81422.1 conserved hypothetical protein [Aeromicrobium sp. 9AM]
MSTIFTKSFLKDAAERAIKTVAQSAAALLVGDGFGILNVDWSTVGSVAGLAGIVSLLTSIGSGYVGDDSPSLVD